MSNHQGHDITVIQVWVTDDDGNRLHGVQGPLRRVQRGSVAVAKPKNTPEPDVKVHLTQGCELCGKTGKHTHTQADWRDLIDRSDPFRGNP